MIFSHRHQFIFFAAGKTGTTSIEKVLADYAEPIPFTYDEKVFAAHIPPEYARDKLPRDVWNSYFKFAFVRNPWDWVISFYLFRWDQIHGIRRGDLWKKPHCLPRRIPLILQRKYGKFDEGCFARFRQDMKAFRRGIDSDNRYQHRFLADADGRILIDYVGRYERLQDDFNVACDAIGIPRKRLPVRNVGRYRERDYTRYYTPATIELVRKHYARDIREFGYSFGE